jgi:outer membrane autotransporter protein
VPALTGAAAAVTDLATPAHDDASRFFWLNGFGGGGRDRASLMDTAHSGLVAGYEIRDGAMRAGVLGGIGQLSDDGPAGTGSVDADTAFAGAYYGGQHGAYDIDALLIAGGLRAETTRGVSGGGNAATGSYDGWYIAPELAVSRRLALSDGWSLTPGARLRYVGTWLDGYTETGSVQNVSYDDRSSHVVEGSLEVRLDKTQTFENGMNLRFDLSATLVESLNLGDPRYDATLVNTAFTTSAFADRAVTGGTFEASAELNVTDSFSVYGGGRLAFYSDDSWWWSAKGGVKVGF